MMMTMVLGAGGCDYDVRCVVVGDDAVGKTSMLMGYATNRYPTQHVPSVFDNYAGTSSRLLTPSSSVDDTCCRDFIMSFLAKYLYS